MPDKVLYVDDEMDLIYIVEFIMQNGGLEIVTINDSTQTIPELSRNNYSLLILDLMMPKMSGFEVLDAIRKEVKLKTLPVLILSSKQLTNEETDLLKENGAQMMTKPFEPHRLLEKVREILSE